MAKMDLSDLKGIKIDELLGELRDEAGKRASSFLSEGRGQVKSARRAVADPNDGDMFGAFVLGLTVGALIGAAIALVVTPLSGSEARRKIAERAEKMRGESGPDWGTAGPLSSDNGKAGYQATTPTYGAGTPVRD